jgi:hypothetical protein
MSMELPIEIIEELYGYTNDYESRWKWNFPIDLPIKGTIENIKNYIVVTGKHKIKTIIPLSTGVKTREYQFIKLIHDDIFIVRLLPRDIIGIDERKVRPEDIRKYSILSISTGKQTESYDFIHFLYDDVFMVGLSRFLGVISSKGDVLCPTEFNILTFPVDGYLFAIKYIEPTHLYPPIETLNDMPNDSLKKLFWSLLCEQAINEAEKNGDYKPQYDILLYDLKGRLPSPLTAAYHT